MLLWTFNVGVWITSLCIYCIRMQRSIAVSRWPSLLLLIQMRAAASHEIGVAARRAARWMFASVQHERAATELLSQVIESKVDRLRMQIRIYLLRMVMRRTIRHPSHVRVLVGIRWIAWHLILVHSGHVLRTIRRSVSARNRSNCMLLCSTCSFVTGRRAVHPAIVALQRGVLSLP